MMLIATSQVSSMPFGSFYTVSYASHACECCCRYNAKVFCGKLPADLQITWSKTLSKTAGMTYYTRTAPVQAGGSWRYADRQSAAECRIAGWQEALCLGMTLASTEHTLRAGDSLIPGV